MAKLFDSSRTNIIEHINNIYLSGELEKVSTCQDFRQVQKEGKRNVTRNIPIYNLDMIISVGYRVNSKRRIAFRKWANKVLKDYLLKGYAVNQNCVVSHKQDYNGEPYCNKTTNVNYAWLFDYIGGCTTYGCTYNDNNTYALVNNTATIGETRAYWTDTPAGVAGSDSYVWIVARNSTINGNYPNNTLVGIRPVITISKSIIH